MHTTAIERVLRLFWLWVDADRFRVTAALGTGLVIPILLALLAAGSGGGLIPVRQLDAAILECSSLFLVFRQLVQSMSIEHLEDSRPLLSVAGVTKPEYLCARAFEAFLIGVAPLLMTAFVCWFHHDTGLMTGGLLVRYGEWLVLLASAAVLLMSYSKPPLSFFFVDLCCALTIAFCPIFYPHSRVPPALRPVVDWLPATLMSGTFATGATPGWPDGLISLWCVGSSLCAWLVFPWSGRRVPVSTFSRGK
jgi:hypothetical protein